MSHVALSRGGNFSHRKWQVHRSQGRNELPGGASLRLEEQEPTERQSGGGKGKSHSLLMVDTGRGLHLAYRPWFAKLCSRRRPEARLAWLSWVSPG